MRGEGEREVKGKRREGRESGDRMVGEEGMEEGERGEEERVESKVEKRGAEMKEEG